MGIYYAAAAASDDVRGSFRTLKGLLDMGAVYLARDLRLTAGDPPSRQSRIALDGTTQIGRVC
jgi:hypothetical protein